MPREGARQAGRQVVGGDEVAKRRSESRPVERVVDGLAHPGVSEQAVLGVKRQLVSRQERRGEVAARLSRGRLAEFACDRGSGSQGRVLVGYVVGVSGFDVSHRLSALRLFAVDDGGKPAGAAAVVVGVAPENRDDTAEVAAQVVGPGRRDRIIESVRDGRGAGGHGAEVRQRDPLGEVGRRVRQGDPEGVADGLDSPM